MGSRRHSLSTTSLAPPLAGASQKTSSSSMKWGQLCPIFLLFLLFRCCSSCFASLLFLFHYCSHFASLFLLAHCSSCFTIASFASLLLFMLHCCSSCFIAFCGLVAIPRASLFLFVLCCYSLCFIVAPFAFLLFLVLCCCSLCFIITFCVSLLLKMLHFVAPPHVSLLLLLFQFVVLTISLLFYHASLLHGASLLLRFLRYLSTPCYFVAPSCFIIA